MNVYKAMAGAVFVFVIFTILSFIVEGEGGLAATRLATATDGDDTTITVTSTTGFLTIDYLLIGDEIICYSGITSTTFTGLTRGCKDTTASTHASDAKVFNEATGIINQAIGFNIAETMSTAGAIKTLTMVPGMLLKLIPRLVMWDYSYLEGTMFGFPLVYLKYVLLYPLSAGFVVGFVVIMINVFMGVARIIV